MRGRTGLKALLVFVFVFVFVIGVVSGAAKATPLPDAGKLVLFNQYIASYCADVNSHDGTNCGGMLKVIRIWREKAES